MNMRQRSQDISSAVRRGGPAAYSFQVDGETFARGFRTGERPLLLHAPVRSGTIGGGFGESTATKEALRVIGSGGRKTIAVDIWGDGAQEDGMVCGGQMQVLIEDIDYGKGA